MQVIAVNYFNDSMPFPLKICDSKKKRATDQWTTDGRTDPHIEMRGRLLDGFD